MRINFLFRVNDKQHLVFGSSCHSRDKNFLLLTYLFSCNVFFDDKGRIKQNSTHFWFSDLLVEVIQIEEGKLERNEEMGLVDLGDPGELIIYKNKTILAREEEAKYLEIPTCEFKQLLKDWVKFLEVNIIAFGSKNWK